MTTVEDVAGEMTSWVKCWRHKHENQSSDPRCSRNRLRVVVGTSYSILGGRDRRILGTLGQPG